MRHAVHRLRVLLRDLAAGRRVAQGWELTRASRGVAAGGRGAFAALPVVVRGAALPSAVVLLA